MPRTGYRTKRRQEKIVDDPDTDERERSDDEYEGEVVRQPRGGGEERERGGHCARREMGWDDIVLRRPRDAAGYPRGRKKGGKKTRWGDSDMGSRTGLYISENERLTNLHILN